MKSFLTELVQGSVFFVTEMFKQRLDKYSRENYRGRDGVAKLEGIDISCQLQDSKILGMIAAVCHSLSKTPPAHLGKHAFSSFTKRPP